MEIMDYELMQGLRDGAIIGSAIVLTCTVPYHLNKIRYELSRIRKIAEESKLEKETKNNSIHTQHSR